MGSASREGKACRGWVKRLGATLGAWSHPRGMLPHPTRLDNATVLPTNPLGPGVIEDSYTDKFDTMACCKGDYNVFFR